MSHGPEVLQREPALSREGPEVSSEPYEEHIRQRLPAGGLVRPIFEELRPKGYGGYATVRRLCTLREEAPGGTVRFETRQQQARSMGAVGRRLPHSVSVHLFVMTLGYSRRLFARGTLDEKLPTFIGCHEAAFEHFGGMTTSYLYDNPRTVVLARNFEGSRIQWMPRFLGLQQLPGLPAAALCRPYRAQTRARSNRGVKYVKRFLRGKAFDSLDHLNEALMNWIATVADERIHGTTHRRPSEMFLEEKALLLDHRQRPPYASRTAPCGTWPRTAW